MSNRDDAQSLQLAFSLHRSGKFAEAAKLYRKIIKRHPRESHALHSLGIIEAADGNHTEAARLMARSLSVQPTNIQFMQNYATVLCQLGDYETAGTVCLKGLEVDRANVYLLYVAAGALFKQSHLQDSLSLFDRLLVLEPNHVAGITERCSVLLELEQYDAAAAGIEKALALAPGNAEVHLGAGALYARLERHNEALASLDKALRLNPGLANAWVGRGNVFFRLKRFDDALAAYDNALSIRNDLADAWLGRGNVLVLLQRYEDAIAVFDKALSLDPDLVDIESQRIHCKMNLCDWTDFEAESDHVVQSVRNGKANPHPFAFLGISSSVEDQFNYVRSFVHEQYPPRDDQPPWREEPDKSGKIRVGYVSSDFREHPVANLAVGVFECHDRSQFEVFGISTGPNDNSEIRRRLERAFDTFVDATALDADDMARLIREQGIDILIDLNGFTRGARTEIFARRPAPVQVNYLGYPGTMGAEYIDYLVADPILVPASHRASYMEKIAYLPNSYQANDSKRAISGKMFTREECGLPKDGFIFCCFNNNFKIVPAVFDLWMRILINVPGSVLWLIETNASAAINLKREAASRGIGAERIIFAKRMPLPDHLARHRLADLFLDTLPYNAHTTASDALWAGLPVLTQIGETFAGRVAASLLTAVGLPELIARTPQQFESMAIELATRPQALAAVRDKLARNRSTRPLFDTALYTRHLESAYAAMHRRHQNGLLPDHIYVPE